MKLAIVSTMPDSCSWGGCEELWVAMAQEALNDKHQVYVAVSSQLARHSKVDALRQKGAIVFQRSTYERTKDMSNLTKLKLVLAQEISKIKPWFEDLLRLQPDIIFINQGAVYDAIWLIPEFIYEVQKRKISYTIICHSNSDSLFIDDHDRQAALSFFTQAHRVLFVSEQNLKLSERQLAQSLPTAVVVQNPVNLSATDLVDWNSNSIPHFACVSRLQVANKGQDILLETLSSEKWQNRAWKLRLYGEGVDKTYLEALAIHYKIADRVEFAGYVKDIRQLWATNHLLVMPSRSEGTPLALVEAMLCGRPVVVTDVGGNTNWVEEGKTGFIADAPTVKLFGEALERAWQAQSLWQQMGVDAYKLAYSKFDKTPGRTLLKLLAKT